MMRVLVGVSVVAAAAVAAAQASSVEPRLDRLVRAKYSEFGKKLSKGDPSFLSFLHPNFTYQGPRGQKETRKTWSDGMRQACQTNRNGRSVFRITKISRSGNDLKVAYDWTYRFKRPVPGGLQEMLTTSNSVDTWRIEGKEIRMIQSRDLKLTSQRVGLPKRDDPII